MGLVQRSREVESESKEKSREVDRGGNAAREGERDARRPLRGKEVEVERPKTWKVLP